MSTFSRPIGCCIAVVFVGLGALPVRAAETAPSKPNIIFILADDIGIPGLGCYGGQFKTPNLDALAMGGTRFEYCFAAPLCAPSRAMAMTGRYAFRTGVTGNGQGAAATPEKDGCVAKRMKAAGYSTAVAGKWRQLSHFRTKEDGAKWGFDEFLIWGAGAPETGEKQGKAASDRYWNPDYNLNGKALPDKQGKYGPDVLQEFVVDYIRRHKDGPFFVYYPTPLIHSPILPTPDSPKGQAKGKKKNADSLYGQNIAYLDKLVGKLVAELDALKIREKTVIVFSGDNGSVGEGTINGRAVDGGKHTMLEGGSRVPLIVNWPGTTPAGVVRKDLVDFTDFLPTFVELAGGQPASGIKIDGRSFAPQVRGQSGTPREWAYVQLGNERYIRDARWKLTGTGELFDMKEAPFRQIQVPANSTEPEAKAARERLKVALSSLVASEPPLPKKKKKK